MNTLKQILSDYKNKHLAMPAFNIDSFEIYQAVEIAVKDTGLPCLVQLSPNEDDFIHAERLLMLAKKANLDGLPIYLNMDHGKDLARLKTLVKLGYDMVHFDGSNLLYSENLTASSAFIKEIKSLNSDIVVEVEFNKINLVGANVTPESFTTPAQALEFMSQTKADLLAVSIGNLHGVNTQTPESIDLELLKNIATAIPNACLTLHGGSGIDTDQISSAINLGVVKININTDLRLVYKRSLNAVLASVNSDRIYEYLNPVISDLTSVVVNKLHQFTGHV
jgi:fructose-bisphosphate aldolase, class II